MKHGTVHHFKLTICPTLSFCLDEVLPESAMLPQVAAETVERQAARATRRNFILKDMSIWVGFCENLNRSDDELAKRVLVRTVLIYAQDGGARYERDDRWVI